MLLALNILAAAVWSLRPRLLKGLGQVIFAVRDQPMTAFAAFLMVSLASYVPMRLIFGDASWFDPGGFPLPIQTSRILLYAVYFFTGVGIGVASLRTGIFAENGEVASRWLLWLGYALAFYGVILLLVYAHHNWIDFNNPPAWWEVAYALAFALFSAAMTFALPATFLRFAKVRLSMLDAMRPSAYGIFLLHYIFIIYLQYLVYDYTWPAGVKAAVVFAGTLALSWTLTIALRRIPVVARMI